MLVKSDFQIEIDDFYIGYVSGKYKVDDKYIEIRNAIEYTAWTRI